MRNRMLVLASVATLACCSSTYAAGWGSVKGRFVLSGAAPTPQKVTITKDKEYCGKFNLVDESLRVDPSTKGIADIVVSLYVRRGKKVKINPDLKKVSGDAVLDNNECRFEPHILFVRVGQKLVIKNTDTVSHNTKIDTFSQPGTNFTIPAKGEISQQFKKEERRPAKVACSIHPWMNGYLVIKDHPYVAISAKDGSFEIKNLPAGKVTFQLWHHTGYVDRVETGGKKKKLKRGLLEVTIKDGGTVDLGEIKVPVDELK